MEVKEAIRHVLDGDGILFLGSGFSLGATNIRNKEFLAGSGIAKHFIELSSLPEGTTLEDATEEFEEKFGSDALIKEVQEMFTAMAVCNYHENIAKLPWKRVYTTNYDNVFEFSARQKSKRVTPVTTSADIYKIPKDHTLCIHLNGYVDSLDRQKIGSELKLTEASYVTSSIEDTPWAMLLRQDIKLASAVFFVGYSLYDLDIKRILIDVSEAKDKSFFYLGRNPEQTTIRKATRYGNVLNETTEDLALLTEEVATTTTPKDRSKIRFHSIREYTAIEPSKITDKDFIDLLLWGRRSENLVAESMRTNKPYYLERPGIDEAVHFIEKGGRIPIICSDLGNGKSLFIEGLRIRMMEKGYRVFDVFDKNEGVEKELEAIARFGGKVCVTIEEYQNWLDEIRMFCANAGDQAVLILTARNAIHDVVVDDLAQLLGDKLYCEINIDVLSPTEIDWVVNTLEQYGLWGKYAGLGKQAKVNFITDKCKGQLHAVLLHLLSSPDIASRLSAVTKRIRNKGDNYEVLLSIFILTILNHPPVNDFLNDIWGPERINTPHFRKDSVIKELVSFNYYAVLVRSPIVAEYILHSLTDASSLVSVLTRMANRIENGSKFSPRYDALFKSLMKFSSLQMILPEQGRRDSVISYYEALKNLGRCRWNPLFWLQYAIASLVVGDLPRAKIYFETAYSLAEERQWDTFQIDNHFARFLMSQAIKEDLDVSTALDNYRQARTIIDRQMRDERRHYPYRVAIHFHDFINKYGGKMKPIEIKEFLSTATRVLTRIEELPEFRRNNKYVGECKKAMNYVIDVASKLLTRNITPATEK